MSSGLGKLLDKSFVLGFALPSLIFLTIITTIFGCPDAICGRAATTNAFAQLTYAVLAVYILAVALLAMNYALYRFFEGYVVPIKWLLYSTNFHRRRLVARATQVAAALRSSESKASILQWQLQRDYPTDPADVLPTAFGNAIRAFELYSYDIYGVDAIGAWPRLLTVLPKSVLDLINDAKALVDLWLNLAGLALALGTFSAGFIILQYGRVALPTVAIGFPWGVIAICSFASSYIAYLIAKSLVAGWGEQVKSAFDCFLPDLAVKFGYSMPRDTAERRRIWEDVNNQLLYGVAFEQPPYATAKKGST